MFKYKRPLLAFDSWIREEAKSNNFPLSDIGNWVRIYIQLQEIKLLKTLCTISNIIPQMCMPQKWIISESVASFFDLFLSSLRVISGTEGSIYHLLENWLCSVLNIKPCPDNGEQFLLLFLTKSNFCTWKLFHIWSLFCIWKVFAT